MKLSQPRMYGRNGKGMWRTPTAKPFEPEGVTLGATVTGTARRDGFGDLATVTGQVWSEAAPYTSHNRGYYWVVDAQGAAWVMHRADMTLTGQAFVDDELLSESA